MCGGVARAKAAPLPVGGGVKRAAAGLCARDAAAALGREEPSLTLWCLSCSMDVRPAWSEGLALARPLPHTQQWRSGELKRGPRLHSAPARTAPSEQNLAYSVQPLPLLLSHGVVSVHPPWCLLATRREAAETTTSSIVESERSTRAWTRGRGRCGGDGRVGSSHAECACPNRSYSYSARRLGGLLTVVFLTPILHKIDQIKSCSA